MSQFIKNRIRTRRHPQIQARKFLILRQFILTHVLLQFLFGVTPTHNIFTKSVTTTTKIALFPDSQAATNTVKANLKEPSSTRQFTHNDDSGSTTRQLKGFDTDKKSDPNPSSKNPSLTHPSSKYQGETTTSSTLNGKQYHGQVSDLGETVGYLGDNRTESQSNDSHTADLKGMDEQVLEEKDLNMNVSSDHRSHPFQDFSTVPKGSTAERVNLIKSWAEEFANLDKSKVSYSKEEGTGSLRANSSRNSSHNLTASRSQQLGTMGDSVTVSEDIVKLNTRKSSSLIIKSTTGKELPSGGDKATTDANTKTANLQALPNLTSCVERCGDITSFPCSCDEKCVIFMNCCNDMRDACPRTYSQAENKFRHLSSAHVRCDPTMVVFMVESCPTSRVTKATTPMPETTAPMNTKSNLASIFSQTPGSSKTRVRVVKERSPLQELLSNAPVTDFATGIIYANATIFECNKPTYLYQELNSTGISWAIQSGSAAQSYPRSVSAINEALDLSTYSYIPPPGQPHSAGPLCYTNVTTSCISRVSIEYGVQSIICNFSVESYYTTLKTYRGLNKFEVTALDICVLCLTKQGGVLMDPRVFGSGLSILMSLAETPGKVLYTLGESVAASQIQLPWLSWTCDVTEGDVDLEAGEAPCQVIQCNEHYHIDTDQNCKKGVDVEFALQNGFLFNGKKCSIEPDVLAETALCFLGELAGLKATNTSYRYFNNFQDAFNLSLTIIRIEMYQGQLGSRLEKEVIEEKFQRAMARFVRKHCFSDQEDSKPKNLFTQTKFLQSQKQKKLETPDINTDLSWSRTGRFKVVEGINSTDIPSSIIFTYCLQTEISGRFLSPVLACSLYGEFALGLEMSFNTDTFANVSEADRKCLGTTAANVNYSSVGRNVHFHVSWVYYIIVLTTTLV